MKFTIIEAAQGSGEWLQSRTGRVTGSKAADVVAKTKTGESQKRKDYKAQLIAERLTGFVADAFVSQEMRWGTEQEPFARMAYESKTGLLVRETGFLSCDEFMIGASLDGDVNNFEGIQEFKCPKSSTHIKWILDEKIPEEHMPQITHNMWVSGAEWCDFVSYDPRMPEPLQLFIVRAHRADINFAEHKKQVFSFIDEIDKMILQLTKAAA